MLLRRIARPLLSVAFIGQAVDTLRNPDGAADAAHPVQEYLHRRLPESAGAEIIDSPRRLALVNAAVQLAAGVLLATGKAPRTASTVLAATVLPANLGAHMFWAEDDPARRASKRRAFFSDVSLIGGLVIASADTAGRPSLGWRARRAVAMSAKTMTSSLGRDADLGVADGEIVDRLTHGLRTGARHGRELAETVWDKSEPMLEATLRRGTEFVEMAREKGTDLLDSRTADR